MFESLTVCYKKCQKTILSPLSSKIDTYFKNFMDNNDQFGKLSMEILTTLKNEMKKKITREKSSRERKAQSFFLIAQF